MKKYRCLICGEVFEVAEGVEPVCPKCGLKGKKLEEIVEAPKANKYAGTKPKRTLRLLLQANLKQEISTPTLHP